MEHQELNPKDFGKHEEICTNNQTGIGSWPPWEAGHPGKLATLGSWPPWEVGHPGKLATDFLQLLVLQEISKKKYHWKA